MTYCCFSYCREHCSRAPAGSAAVSCNRATAGKLEHTFHVFCHKIYSAYSRIYPRRRVLRSCVVLVRQFNQMFNLFLLHEVDAWLDSGSLCVCVCLFVWCLLNANISNGCCKLLKLIYVHIVPLCVTYEGAHRNDDKIIYIYILHSDTRAAVFLWCCWKWWWQKYRSGINSTTNRILMAADCRSNIWAWLFDASHVHRKSPYFQYRQTQPCCIYIW